MKIDIGLNDAGRKSVANSLSKVLADTYMLYLKTQNFHWNVTGHHFHQLHLLFEEQYKNLAGAVDEVAERIRSLGFHAPATFTEFTALTALKEPQGVPNANEMIRQLLTDQEAVSRTARSALSAAQEARDEVSGDLMIERMSEHDKAAWMLRSHLEG